MYKLFFKRALDFTISLIAFILLSPIFIIVVIFLFIANNGKPFFFQRRPGKDERIFTILKFKTMNDKKNKDGNLLSDEQRMTKVGSFVRKTSLDEIPQLLNVIKGDMSLIGPRPLLVDYLKYYNREEKERLSVRPGITGLTGVSGRNNLTWYQKMNYDIEYVRNFSFNSDCKIFFKTIKKVLVREGISKDGFVTTESFTDYCISNPDRTYDNK